MKQDTSKETRTATDLIKAEQLHLQATFRLMKCQAHYSVYSSHLKKVAHDGLEFVDEALKLFPNNPSYLNTKALLLADGLGDMEQSIQILKRTSAILPDDIQLRQNLRDATEQQKDSRTITVIALIVFFFIIVGAIIYIVNNS